MLLSKVTATALLTFVAFGAATSAANAFEASRVQTDSASVRSLQNLKSEDDGNEGPGHDNGNGHGHGKGTANNDTDPLVMPPVVIKPYESNTGEDDGNSWTPNLDPNAVPSPDPSALPFAVGPQARLGVGPLPSSALDMGVPRHSLVVSPVSPAEHPALPGAQSLLGEKPKSQQSEQRIDPNRNQAIVINRLSGAEQSPLQEFIDIALVVMAILGALSLGLVSLLVRSARVAKSTGH